MEERRHERPDFLHRRARQAGRAGREHRPRTGRPGSDRHPAEQYAQSPGACRRPDDRRGEHCKYRLAAEYRPHQRGQQALRHRAEPVDHDAERLQQPQGSHRRRLYSRAQRGLRRRHEGPQQHYGVHSEEPGVGQCHHRLCRRDRRGRRRAGCLCGRCKDSRSRQCNSHCGDPWRQCHHGRYRCRGRNHGRHRCSGHRCGE